MRRWRWIMPAAGWGPIQSYMKLKVERTVPGPNAGQLEKSRTAMWGCVTNEAGHSVTATLSGPGGYVITYETALAAVERMISGEIEPGYRTPSQAFGMQFIRDACDVDIQFSEADAVSDTPA